MMKINVMCGMCLYGRNGGIRPEDLPLDFDTDDIPFSEVLDGNIYEVTCKNGHRQRFVLLNEKFEILFDYACSALIDGYYRDAVASFVAALERFYEFCVRTCASHGGVSEGVIHDAWKLVSAQSERQLGAFAFTYLNLTGKPFSHLTTSDVAFRNQVIHKGYIPNKNDAVDFGEAIRVLVNGVIKDFKEIGKVDLLGQYEQRSAKIKEIHKEDSVIRIQTVLDVRGEAGLAEKDLRGISLHEILGRMERSYSFVVGL